MRSSRILNTALAASGFCLFNACAGADASDTAALEFDTEESQEALYADSNALAFPARDQELTVVNVCWDTLAGHATRRAKIQEGAELWSAATNNWLTFTGWNTTCDENPEGVRLYFGEGTACATSGAGVRFGASSSDTRSKYCGVHELGHVIGFNHDHMRFDAPELCPSGNNPSAGGSPGDLYMGQVDPQSVMSYCAGQATSLSEGDIAGAKKVFGDGSDVVHNKNYALRFQDSRYMLVNQSGSIAHSNRAISTATGQRYLLRVTRQAGSGSVMYGDKIALQRAPAKSCDTNAPGACITLEPGSSYICPVNGEVGTGTSPCYWTVERTAGGRGSSVVDVNDPIRLKSGNVWLNRGGEKDARFTGDFDGTRVYNYSRLSEAAVSRNGVALYPDETTANFFCKENGYIGGSLGSTYSGSGVPAWVPAQAIRWVPDADANWFGSGDWVPTPSNGSVAGGITCRK